MRKFTCNDFKKSYCILGDTSVNINWVFLMYQHLVKSSNKNSAQRVYAYISYMKKRQQEPHREVRIFPEHPFIFHFIRNEYPVILDLFWDHRYQSEGVNKTVEANFIKDLKILEGNFFQFKIKKKRQYFHLVVLFITL